MKLAVLCVCFVHLACVSSRLFTRDDAQAARSAPVSRARASQSSGSMHQGRVTPLFARRGQYERQRIHVPKPKPAPVAQNDLSPPAKVAPNPVNLKCSRLTQSCLPQSGCCDPCATCHCRFFNAICFCRKTSLQHKKKTKNTGTPKLRQK